jgi:hypothetical protein
MERRSLRTRFAQAVAGSWLRAKRCLRRDPHWGDFRRLTPFSRVFGLDRGKPIDRFYIEKFLDSCREDIRGDVVEIGDATYTKAFGGSRVRRSEILHAVEGNSQATLVGNLATGAGVPAGAYDCMILTQTFPFLYDVQAAAATVFRSLRPGGVALVTLSGISQISRYDMDRWGDYWRFTDASARRLFAKPFGDSNVTIRVWGNVLAAMAFLHGLAAVELTADELNYHDSDYPVTVSVRAVKGSA